MLGSVSEPVQQTGTSHKAPQRKVHATQSLKTRCESHGTTLKMIAVKPAGMENFTKLIERIILSQMDPPIAAGGDNDNDKLTYANKRREVLNNKMTRRRYVFNSWPRDPKGGVLTAENSVLGKETPDKIQLWGATLLDFYYTNRVPINPNKFQFTDHSITVSTGSKLLGWMEKHGEDYAVDQLDLARLEPDPEVIEPLDIAQLIREKEQLSVQHALEPILKRLPPRPALRAPRYPMPWPRPPFCSDTHQWPEPPMLEKLIPLSSLPKTLIVHDPWGATDGKLKSCSDNWKPPTTETKALRYRLQLSRAGEERVQRELEEAKKQKEAKDKIMATFLADPHTRNPVPEDGFFIATDSEDELWTDGAEVDPRILCLLPPMPTVDPNEPAHLRLSPSHLLGSGHHSVLYDAEFELPRDLLAERPICSACIIESAVRICAEEDAVDPDKKWAKTKGKVTIHRERDRGYSLVTADPASGKDIEHSMEPPSDSVSSVYDGPVRVVRVDVNYLEPFDKPCKHFTNNPGEVRFSPTTTVRVAAKLSRPGDSHLDAEARNYESFPLHFFQHWSGLCIPPRHQYPVPVGAIAPQYYGYYVFDGLVDDDDPIAEGPLTPAESAAFEENEALKTIGTQDDRYYSPIMLLENCGQPIESDKLSVDDREQAISLFNRFHHAGWCHLSLYQRNIVMKPGPINVTHQERLNNSKQRGGLGEEWTFRLIDYGRSCVYNNENHPSYERHGKENMVQEAQTLWRWMNIDDHPGF
ncbi:hypothetical protein BJ165DRAFT_1464210 [Panaeolus papilionaceus]|nr:hypothetical protein BJ165DRAFT_1464210 [Panaeolus papilionaceus]